MELDNLSGSEPDAREAAVARQQLAELAWSPTEHVGQGTAQSSGVRSDALRQPAGYIGSEYDADVPWWRKVIDNFHQHVDEVRRDPAKWAEGEVELKQQIEGADASFESAITIGKQQLSNINHEDYAKAKLGLRDAEQNLRSELSGSDELAHRQVAGYLMFGRGRGPNAAEQILLGLNPRIIAAVKALDIAYDDPILTQVAKVREQVGAQAMFSTDFRNDYARLLVEEGRTGDALVELVRAREFARRFQDATTP